MRPKRKVTNDGVFYKVDGASEWFATTDGTLAEEVRKDLDRRDPLPCPHDCPQIEITSLGDPGVRTMCRDCGHQEVT